MDAIREELQKYDKMIFTYVTWDGLTFEVEDDHWLDTWKADNLVTEDYADWPLEVFLSNVLCLREKIVKVDEEYHVGKLIKVVLS